MAGAVSTSVAHGPVPPVRWTNMRDLYCFCSRGLFVWTMDSQDLVKLVLFLSLFIAAGGALLFILFALSFILGKAPFVPTPSRVIGKMMELADIKPGEKVYDLGCGDGRLVIEAHRRFGARAVGIEISPLAYLLARIRVLVSGADVALVLGNCFSQDISDADVVFCYLLPGHMHKLQQRFRTLKKSCRIISHQFEIPGVRPRTRIEVEGRSYVATILKYAPSDMYDTVSEGLRVARSNAWTTPGGGLCPPVREGSR